MNTPNNTLPLKLNQQTLEGFIIFGTIVNSFAKGLLQTHKLDAQTLEGFIIFGTIVNSFAKGL